jgi:hypothetical protein
MWDTAEGLARLFYGSQWAMALLGALTALAIVFSIVVSVRRDQIVARDEAAKAASTQSTIDGQSSKISSLTGELSTAKKKLEDLTSQRTLTPDQKSKVIAYLKKSPPQEATIVRVEDLETQTYAEEITKVLTDGGWKMKPPMFRIITHAEPGLMIMVRDIHDCPLGATLFQKAFLEAGITVYGVSSAEVAEKDFVIWIGPKKTVGN